MIKKVLTASLTFLSAAIAASPAHAFTINFDSLPANTVITNQFPEATFTSTSGFEIRTIAFSIVGSSSPNVIAAYTTSGSFSPNQNVIVTFAQAVNNLFFLIVGDGSINPAQVDIFNSSGFVSTVNLVSDSSATTGDIQDLSSFADITSINIKNITDPGGIGYDNFTFTPVPFEFSPTLGISILGGAWLVRKKLRKSSTTSKK